MVIANIIERAHSQSIEHIKFLRTRVNDVLRPYCEKENFPYISRIKSLESISDKVETGRYKSWNDLDDLFAATIIIPNLNKESEVIKFLKINFDMTNIKKRGSTLKSPETFSFNSTRFIGKLKQTYAIDPQLLKLNFEVQIKTAFEYAWAIATHSFTYKTNKIEWNKLRLSAQLMASVEQLDMLINGSEDVCKHITKHKWAQIEYKTKILNFFTDLVKKKMIPEESIPSNLNRFSDNILNLLGYDYNNPKYNSKPIDEMLSKIEEKINSCNNESIFPRSISLFQFILGVTLTNEIFNANSDKYTLLITDDLEKIFPEIKKISKKFKRFNNSDKNI